MPRSGCQTGAHALRQEREMGAWKVVFESPVVWTEKRPQLNQVGPFATGLSVAVAEGLGKWQLQSATDPENS